MSKKPYSGKVITTLGHKLMKLDRLKHEKGLLTSDVHFTRKRRKLDFREDMKILMFIGSMSMKKELYEYFDYGEDTVITVIHNLLSVQQIQRYRFPSRLHQIQIQDKGRSLHRTHEDDE